MRFIWSIAAGVGFMGYLAGKVSAELAVLWLLVCIEELLYDIAGEIRRGG